MMKKLALCFMALILICGCSAQNAGAHGVRPVLENPYLEAAAQGGYVLDSGCLARLRRPVGMGAVEKNGRRLAFGARKLYELIDAGAVVSIGPVKSAYPLEESAELSGKTVFIDAGHGKGAPGGTRFEDIYEHTLTLAFAQLLRENLENMGANVVMTRTSEADVDNYVRMAGVNKYTLERLLEAGRGDEAELAELIACMDDVIEHPENAYLYFGTPYDESQSTPIKPVLRRIFELQKDKLFDDYIFVSIHTNGPGSSGTFTYAMSNTANMAYYAGYDEDRINALAARLQAGVTRGGGFVNRAIRYNDFFMVRETNITSALMELAYLHDGYDRARLLDQDVQKRIVNGVALGIADYFSSGSNRS